VETKTPKIIAILQPGYIPWLGFFELMARANLFVYFDNVQYTHRDWRNRNRIKMQGNWKWLTVPVIKSARSTLIRDIRINYNHIWIKSHLRSLKVSYSRAPFFSGFYEEFAAVLLAEPTWLWELDVHITELMKKYLHIKTPCYFASDIPDLSNDKNMRITDICRHFGAQILYDSSAASNFIDHDLFESIGLKVIFQKYNHPVYPQINGKFIPFLSTIDLIFNTGSEASNILLSTPSTLSTELTI